MLGAGATDPGQGVTMSDMSLASLETNRQGVELLQRSLERGRLGHAYLFSGARMAEMEALARALAATLNCANPSARAANGLPLDACDVCPSCRQTLGDVHADVHWLRPESKLRIIRVEQMREFLRTLHMKATGTGWKLGIVAGADRMRVEAANTFLKSLEEPPPRSVLLLLTTEPERVLDTLRSRCLRLNLGGESVPVSNKAQQAWLAEFAAAAAGAGDDLLARYRLLARLPAELGAIREAIGEELTARSPLQRYDELEEDLRKKWESELAAAIEAEYRRRRGDFLAGLLWWLRDVWLCTLGTGREFLGFPELAAHSEAVAGRLDRRAARENVIQFERTMGLLHTNVQETLALEVGLLRLRL